MLHVHLSNRIEALAARLLHALDGPREDLFAAEQVIVPSAGLKRWLTLRIAATHGVCAQFEFHYLATWLWARLHSLQPDSTAGLALTPPVLAWRLWRLLGDDGFVHAHPRLAEYLRDGDEVSRLELAERCAAALDQVLTFRPDWLRAWSQGRLLALEHDEAGDEAWHAGLWQRIAAELGLGAGHPLQPLGELAAAAAPGALPAALRSSLPATLHVFALPAIAPLHAELLQALSRHIDVHVYAINPCREYWFELVPPRRFGRIERAQALAHEVGHPLLAGWGRQTQASIDTLLDRCPQAEVDDSLYAPLPDEGPLGGGPTLLAQLHNGLLELTPPQRGELRLDEGDRSIEWHRCHSLTRELEVLQDRLLGLFAEDASLRPGDILVVTPDLAAAAPLVDAVFGTAPPQRRIAWRLTGLSQAEGSAPARCLMALLDLLSSRALASDVFALLQEPIVARRFGLDDGDVVQLHDALLQAGLHWGLDAGHRESLALGTSRRHTLDEALERLLLGHVMPSGDDEPFEGLLPCGDLEGQPALALGALARLTVALQRLRRALALPRPAAHWGTLLLQATRVFFACEGDDRQALQDLRQTLAELTSHMHAGGLDEHTPISLPLLRRVLQERLAQPARGGVPGGSVTFAAMSSLRNLPYRVVAMIGLDGAAFPARVAAADFDLIAAHPRRGDRQRRLDDRNVFLDLLLAARGHVHLSCTARSARDNSALAPSVLVDELLEFVIDGLAPEDADAAQRQRWRDRLVVEHTLQAFALEPFLSDTDPRARSHDAELARALRDALGARGADGADPGDDHPAAFAAAPFDESEGDDDDPLPQRREPAFFIAPLPLPDAQGRTLTLDALCRFFHNPSRQLLRDRLDLVLPFDDEELADDEPLLLDRAAERAIARRLLPRALAGASLEALQALALAGPEPPDSVIGQQQLGEWLRAMHAFAQRLQPLVAEAPHGPLTLHFETEVHGQRWCVEATLNDLRRCGVMRWRFDTMRAADQLDTWLLHLLLQATQAQLPDGSAPLASCMARDATLLFTAVPDAAVQLTRLLRLVQEGACEPLPFHLRSAEVYMRKGPSLKAAQDEWRSHRFHRGEAADPARTLAWRGQAEPLGAAFQAHAQTVFGPLLAHAQWLPSWQPWTHDGGAPT